LESWKCPNRRTLSFGGWKTTSGKKHAGEQFSTGRKQKMTKPKRKKGTVSSGEEKRGMACPPGRETQKEENRDPLDDGFPRRGRKGILSLQNGGPLVKEVRELN